jgi:hypothetical protein
MRSHTPDSAWRYNITHARLCMAFCSLISFSRLLSDMVCTAVTASITALAAPWMFPVCVSMAALAVSWAAITYNDKPRVCSQSTPCNSVSDYLYIYLVLVHVFVKLNQWIVCKLRRYMLDDLLQCLSSPMYYMTPIYVVQSSGPLVYVTRFQQLV